MTRELIRQKLAGQELVAKHELLDTTTADTMARFGVELPKADSNDIRSAHRSSAGIGVLVCWSAWRTLPINFAKNDYIRGTGRRWQIWLAFREGRATGSKFKLRKRTELQ